MDLHPTRDHQVISDSAAEYLLRELPADRSPKLTESSLSPKEWQGLADMGWFAMGLPEHAGGLGLTIVEEALVQREFGRSLLPPSTLATMLAGALAVELGDLELAGELAGGGKRAAIAIPVEPFTAKGPSTGAYRLVDTGRADIAIGWSPQGAFLAPLTAFKGAVEVPSMDATLDVMTAEGLDAGLAKWRADTETGFNARARVLTAATLTGGAEAVRDLSAQYAKERHQFGKPIGMFQAVAHPLADMAVRCEASLAALFYAAVCVRDQLPERDLYCAAARSVAYRGAYDSASASMQVHGGYGQTYEYLPHFYLKRAVIYGLTGGGVEPDDAEVLAADSILSN